MELNDLFVHPEILRAMATIMAGVLMIAITVIAGAVGIERVTRAWRYLRGQWPGVIELVNEPTDPVNVRIDQALDRLYPGDWAGISATVLPELVTRLGQLLDLYTKTQAADQTADNATDQAGVGNA